jgi:hypothetical protein
MLCTYYPEIAKLAAVIAQSQIVVPRRPKAYEHLPAGYEQIDFAILEWIAAEGRRVGGGLPLI